MSRVPGADPEWDKGVLNRVLNYSTYLQFNQESVWRSGDITPRIPQRPVLYKRH
jgi:hypothetical protein